MREKCCAYSFVVDYSSDDEEKRYPLYPDSLAEKIGEATAISIESAFKERKFDTVVVNLKFFKRVEEFEKFSKKRDKSKKKRR